VPKPTEILDVVAIQRGTTDPERVIVLTGHIDSRVSDPLNAAADAPGGIANLCAAMSRKCASINPARRSWKLAQAGSARGFRSRISTGAGGSRNWSRT